MGICGVRELGVQTCVIRLYEHGMVGSIWVEGVTGSVSASTMLGRYPGRDALLFSKSALFHNALEKSRVV